MRNPIIGVLALCMLMNLGTGSAAGDEPPAWDHLPESLRTAIGGQMAGMVMMYRWSAMGRHPVFVRAAEARRQKVNILVDDLPSLAQLPIDLLESFPLGAEEIEELWVLNGVPGSLASGPGWIRTNLARDGLIQSLAKAGWQRVPGSCPDMMAAETPPSSPGENETTRRGRTHPERSSEPPSQVGIRIARVCPGDDGWAQILIPGAEPSIPNPAAPSNRAQRPLPPGLAAPGPHTLMTGVFLVGEYGLKEWDGDWPVPAGDLTSLDTHQLIIRISSLEEDWRQRRREPPCDISMSVDETNDGLRLAARGSCPTAFDADTAASTTGLILAMLRVSAAPLSSALANELGQAHAHSHGNSVRSDVALSTASLLEAIDRETAYHVELRRLFEAYDAARGR